MSDSKGGGLDGLLGKAEDALGNFMGDPEKVDKAKTKAEGLLGKYMDQSQAELITGGAEGILKKVSDRSSGDSTEQ